MDDTNTAWVTTGLGCLAVSLMPAVPDAAVSEPLFLTESNPARYRQGNLSFEILTSDLPLSTGDLVVDHYRPRTELGRQLVELRRAYILEGGKLLNWEELDEEIRERRGGVVDE